MFRVKSSFKTQFEIQAPADKVRDFFRNLANFTEMLGGVDSIRRESGGIARWMIATDTQSVRCVCRYPCVRPRPAPM